MKKQSLFTKTGKIRMSKTLISSVAVAGLISLGAQPANAASMTEAESPAAVGIDAAYISEGTIADSVRDSGSLAGAVEVLEANNFNEVPVQGNTEVRYEKTVDGISIGFSLPTANQLQPALGTGMQPYWGVGWNWGQGGPYVKGTPSEWQAAAGSGAIIGGAACAFISAGLGEGACVVAVGLADQWIQSHDLSDWPSNICVAVSPPNNVWFEEC